MPDTAEFLRTHDPFSGLDEEALLSGLPSGFEERAQEDGLCYSIEASDVIPLLAPR